MKTFVAVLVMAAETAGVGALAMLAMSGLHEDVPAVPAIGFNASWLAIIFLVTLGRVILPHKGDR